MKLRIIFFYIFSSAKSHTQYHFYNVQFFFLIKGAFKDIL